MKKPAVCFCLWMLAQGSLLAEEVPLHWEYFEPGIDYSHRLRVTGATTNWTIAGEPTPEKTGRSLKLTMDFSKEKVAVLVFDLPLLAFDRIRLRLWNPNAPTTPLYAHLSAYQGNSMGAFRENISFLARYYGDPGSVPATEGMKKNFLKPDKPSAPLPNSKATGWFVYEVNLPRDIVNVVSNGTHRPLTQDEQTNWKNYALPTVSLLVETKPPATGTPAPSQPVTLYIGSIEFYLSK